MAFEKDKQLDTKKIVDAIENAVYAEVKPLGFKKHGRTLHRFVGEDISQVINFQTGCPPKGVYDVLWVNIGIRVPECMLRSFACEESAKKYYHEYECNIRARLGEVEGGEEKAYDLHLSEEEILSDILRQIKDYVIPCFSVLESREAILEKRRYYPNMDVMNHRLILLENAMIYGRMGKAEEAQRTFNEYYNSKAGEYKGHEGQKSHQYIKSHMEYLEELAKSLGIEIRNKT
ncbi:MAG: DUF4304 domain-containing protein [Clostridia bacterium]|nr:DUF4304 domain-containing protein [Clostridia bacterium]